MDASKLRVIVVGGGPVGLTAALALERAGIDFVLLESRSNVVIDAGSNLVLLPIGLRAFYQLGLRDPLNAVSSPLDRIHRMDHTGRDIGDAQWFIEMRKNFGAFPRVISRRDLTKVLYDALPAEARENVLPKKKLCSIATVANGVVATCADGSSYAGSIVIGADGAHSMVRDIMSTLSLNSGSAEAISESPFLTTYRCLWARFPRTPEVAPGTTCETHGRDAATQFFAGEDSAVVGVYERMEEPTRERVHYTKDDQDALVNRWGHLPLTPGGKVTLREVYESRLEAGLVSLEEGVVKDWSWAGRIVLAGDAAHKFTPSTGAGCNNGVVDIVALVNELHALVEDTRAASGNLDAVPASEAFASAFKAYQDLRFTDVEAGWQGSSKATATATWQTGVHKLIDRQVLSRRMVQQLLTRLGAPAIARTPVFDFVTGEEQLIGKVPWTTPLPHAEVQVN